MRSLLVTKDVQAAEILSGFLRSNDIVSEHACEGEEALEMVRHYDFDVVIAEGSLSDMDVLELVRRLRVARVDVPVLVLAAAGRSDLRVRLFSAGADDVVVRPFDTAELVARMRAVLRRYRGFSDASLKVGPLTIRQDRREVAVDGAEVKLTGKEYAILELLVLRRGTVLTKDAFLNHLYGGMDEPEAKIIDVFVCKLRKKLALCGAESLITTVWGRGYMLRDNSREQLQVGDAPRVGSLLSAA